MSEIKAERLRAHLAVVECPMDGKIMHVHVGDGSHLCLLNGRDAPFRVQNKYGDVCFVSQPIDGSTKGKRDEWSRREGAI